MVSAGGAHTVAIKEDGTLWVWGQIAYEVGGGSIGVYDSLSPVQIGTDTDWAMVSAGGAHTVAIKEDGTLWVFGRNYGDGTIVGSPNPVQIGTDTDWAMVSAGDRHTAAIKEDGTLWAWGLNFSGQIGDGTTDDNLSPIQIGTDTDWAMVSAGAGHTAAIKEDGTLWAWGWNDHGRLGDGTTDDNLSPIQIGTDTDWAMVSAGAGHTAAIKEDGTLWAWGWNSFGQLGDGTTDDSLSPIQIGTDTDWTMETSPNCSMILIKTDGTLWAWGWNNYGQLGDGTTTNKNVPTMSVSASLPNGAVGTEYTATLLAIGDMPISWYIESGSLPEGLELSLSGIISGTPTASGIFNFNVKATNGVMPDAIQAFTLTVTPALIYEISLTPSNAKDFGSATFGYGAQTPYSVTVNNTGNQPTGVLTIALSGTSADSFTLSTTSMTSLAVGGNNSFTVVPKTGLAVGTYTATVTVSGTNGISETFNVSFTVNPVPTCVVTVNNGTGGGSYAAGATVNITANTALSGQVFDKWTTSSGVTFANANNASTSFTMIGSAVTVTATYKDVPVSSGSDDDNKVFGMDPMVFAVIVIAAIACIGAAAWFFFIRRP